MYPYWADTPGIAFSLPPFHAVTRRLLRTPQDHWLGGPRRRRESFWHDRRIRPTHLVPWTREAPADRGSLWVER